VFHGWCLQLHDLLHFNPLLLLSTHHDINEMQTAMIATVPNVLPMHNFFLMVSVILCTSKLQVPLFLFLLEMLQFGCCEALALLSSHYLTTVYPKAWNSFLSNKTGGQKPNAKRSTR